MMKTKEFIEKTKSIGFNINIRCEDIQVHHHRYGLIATVQINKRYIFDIKQYFDIMSTKEQDELFSCVVEYARTPLEEREEEEKYYVKLKNEVLAYNMNGSYLNYGEDADHYLFSDNELSKYYTSQFTQKQIDGMPDEVKTVLPLCEKIEVTSND